MSRTALTAEASLGSARFAARGGLLLELVGWGACLALGTWLRLQNLGIYTGSFDEGIRSQQMLLMAAGFRPFQDIFASQGPLLLDLLFPFYLVLGQSLEAIRLGVVLLSIVALLGAGWTARLVAGRVAGIATLAVLSVSPAFLESSRLALAETPSLAPAVLAVAAAVRYQQIGQLRWAIAAGLLLAFAVLIKPMVIPAAACVGLLMLLRTPVLPRHLAGFVGAGLALSIGVVLALGPAGVYDDLGAYRGGASQKLGSDVAENLRLVQGILGRERLVVLGLAVTALLSLARSPRLLLPLASWPLAVAGLFYVYDDLADKHIVYLTFPLALLAGIGSGATVSAVLALVRQRSFQVAPVALMGVLALVGYLGDLPRIWRADQFMLNEAGRVAESRRDIRADIEIAELMRRVTSGDRYVLSDNPNAAFRARILVPPKLVDTSGTRIDAGSLTAALAIETARATRPTVIVTAPNRMGKLSTFVRWMTDGDYELVKSYEVGWKVYLRRDLLGS